MIRVFSSIFLVLALAVTFPVTAWASSTPNSPLENILQSQWSYDRTFNSYNSPSSGSGTWYKSFSDLTFNFFKSFNYQLSGNQRPSESSQGTSLFQTIYNIYSSLTSTSSGTILSYMASDSQKLSQINTTLGTGTSLKNVMSNLNDIVSWTSSSSYTLDRIYSNGLDVHFDNNIQSKFESISSNSAITASNISSLMSGNNNIPFNYNQFSGFAGSITSVSLPGQYVPYYSFTGNSPRVSFSTSQNMSLYGYLDLLNKNLLNSSSFLHTNNVAYRVYHSNNGDYLITDTSQYSWSVMDILQNINLEFGKSLSALSFILADPATIQAKKNNSAQEQSFLTNFTGSGSAAASASDFSNMATAANDFSSGLSGGASYDNTFNFMNGDSDAWDWFTQQAADDLDSVQTRNNRRFLRSSSDTPLLDEYYNSIFCFLGGGS